MELAGDYIVEAVRRRPLLALMTHVMAAWRGLAHISAALRPGQHLRLHRLGFVVPPAVVFADFLVDARVQLVVQGDHEVAFGGAVLRQVARLLRVFLQVKTSRSLLATTAWYVVGRLK